ncbi:MAG: hypothetical protein K2Q20_09800, partial [Phycisphaerales bacterium]|nr:hypothetical protein [Phycisphaerales bacterium]
MTTPSRQLDLHPSAECLACRYSLAGVAEPICPECGRAFNPDNPLTYGPRTDHPFLQWGLRGPGRTTFISAGVVGLLSALAGSTPLMSVGWFGLALLSGLGVLGVSVVRALVATWVAVRRPEQRMALWQSRMRWVVLAGLGSLCMGLVAVKPVWRLRWLVSRPAFDALAADVRAGVVAPRTRQCGLISAEGARLVGNNVRVVFDGGGFLDTTVFIH